MQKIFDEKGGKKFFCVTLVVRLSKSPLRLTFWRFFSESSTWLLYNKRGFLNPRFYALPALLTRKFRLESRTYLLPCLPHWNIETKSSKVKMDSSFFTPKRKLTGSLKPSTTVTSKTFLRVLQMLQLLTKPSECHIVWKLLKLSQSTLRAKWARFTFWMDKKFIKNA